MPRGLHARLCYAFLVSSDLGGCEATHFAVASTNQNAGCASHVKADSESSAKHPYSPYTLETQ